MYLSLIELYRCSDGVVAVPSWLSLRTGVAESEFEQTKATLIEEGDRCVELVKQMALTRQFDIKQAVAIVKMMDDLSPFDKVQSSQDC